MIIVIIKFQLPLEPLDLSSFVKLYLPIGLYTKFLHIVRL